MENALRRGRKGRCLRRPRITLTLGSCGARPRSLSSRHSRAKANGLIATFARPQLSSFASSEISAFSTRDTGHCASAAATISANFSAEMPGTDLWGYAPDEQLTNEALVKEQYRGIRPAPGYPACPEHSLKGVLFDLLDAGENAGLELTESFAMLPTAAVSGFYFGHAEASYFGVARIGRDQVEDYAARRGVDLPTAEPSIFARFPGLEGWALRRATQPEPRGDDHSPIQPDGARPQSRRRRAPCARLFLIVGLSCAARTPVPLLLLPCIRLLWVLLPHLLSPTPASR
eukprot:gene36437-49080_t